MPKQISPLTTVLGDEQLLTLNEVAARVHVAPSTVRGWIRGHYYAKGRRWAYEPFIPVLRVGRNLRFEESALNAWLERRRQERKEQANRKNEEDK